MGPNIHGFVVPPKQRSRDTPETLKVYPVASPYELVIIEFQGIILELTDERLICFILCALFLRILRN